MAGVLDQLASALGRNDEQPNVELAEDIVARRDSAAIAELAAVLTGKDKAVAHDAIKVLYETGARDPGLIAPHAQAFLDGLTSKSNRMIWGAMSALEAIAATEPAFIRTHLEAIMAASAKGSVITRDRAVGILCRLAAAGDGATALPLLIAQLADAPVNQLPSYAEAVAAVVDAAHRPALRAAIAARLPDLPAGPKRARLDKALKRIDKAGPA